MPRRPDGYRQPSNRPGAAPTRGVTVREGGGLSGWWNSLIEDGDYTRWIPIGLVALLAIGLTGFALSGGDDNAKAAGGSIPAGSTVPGVVATSMAAQPMQTVATTAPLQKSVLSRTITNGMSGDDVKDIQERLIALGYDPGPADGVYGHRTISAMWAFKKLILGVPRDQVTDEVTPEVWDRMQDSIQVAPRRANANSVNHVEIYLVEQVMVLFNGTTPRLIAHISTGELDPDGTPAAYCEKIVRNIDKFGAPLEKPIPGEACGEAKTPGGIFKIHRMEKGRYVGPLGAMYDPVYFNYGIAIHGANEIPLYPASHGCIRIEQHISDYFQTLVAKGDEVAVWNGVKAPEEVTDKESLPYFDRFKPDETVPETTPPASEVATTPAPATTTPAKPSATTTTTTTAPAKQTTTTSSTTTTTSTTTSTTSSTTSTTLAPAESG